MNNDTITTGALGRLFIHLKKRYGVKWDETFDGEDSHRLTLNAWYEKLKHNTLADVRRGLDNWQSSEPPNIDQFVECCKSDQKKRSGRPSYEMWDGNDKINKCSRKSADNHMTKIKEMLP